MPMPDGTIGHAEIALNGSVVMLSTAWTAAGMKSPRDLGGVHGQIRCTVPDVDAHYAHAKSAGAIVIGEPENQFYGERIYRAVDTEGHRWIFATPVQR